jgi:hypothetical protein
VDLLDIALTTPGVPGDYVLRWDLVEEGVTWFFRQGAAPLEVAVEISDQAQFVAWTALASHQPADVALAFDGNPDTAWDSGANQQPGMWFQLDLGQVRVVDRVKATSPGRGFPVAYNVKLSENGQDWRLVAASDKNWRDIDASFSPCRARYVRLEQTGTPQWTTTWTISEIAVAFADPWAGAEASHFTADSGKAIDARLDTAWNTRNALQKPGMWFKLDMGSLRLIERVVLQHPKNQQPRGYIVQISGDGQNWQEVGRKDDNWAMVDVTFAPAAARYVRVETTNSSPYQPWGIAEFIAWDSSPRWLRGHR